jgi:surface carbohydrate biosynthesis protein (TIGR04326 family)
VVFDGTEDTPTADYAIYWQRYLDSDSRAGDLYSLPQLVTDKADYWKSLYLEWLADLAASPLGDHNLEEALSITPGLSYWWMALPSQWSFGRDCIAYSALRMWALSALADELSIDHISLVGASPEIASVLVDWGNRTGRVVVQHRAPAHHGGKSSRGNQRNSLRYLATHFMAAFRYLGSQYVRYRRTMRYNVEQTFPAPLSIKIIDYFDNFSIDMSAPVRYRSNYWGPLPELLESLGIPVTWIHLDPGSSSGQSRSERRSLLADLNSGSAMQQHFLLQDGMTAVTLLAAIGRYLRMAAAGRRARSGGLTWVHHESRMDMWPVIRERWMHDFIGQGAAQNALSLTLFERLSPTPSGRDWLYLMENQPWELALLESLSRRGQGSAVGVAHSTVRKWDLRYALGLDPKSGVRAGMLPLPDEVLANGPAARIELERDGFSPDRIEDVEALRYIRLNQAVVGPNEPQSGGDSAMRLLALGEYDPETALEQIAMLNSLVSQATIPVRITFRPHPSANSHSEHLDSAIAVSVAASIETDLAQTDVVFCGGVSSASVDSVLMGLPTIVFPDARTMDGRLVPEEALAATVFTSEDLLAAVLSLRDHAFAKPNQDLKVFNVDPSLQQWKGFLAD